jgi:SAM-dependent methyltransferase
MTVVDEARRTSFDHQAARYDAIRPSYHPGVVGELAGLGTRVLEVGAGTGKATELLARAGFAITALEPGAQLAAVLRAKQLANVTVVESRFEDFGAGDFDIVLAAQAWHWIDPARRFALAAAAAPTLALVYNVGAYDPALRDQLAAIYARYFPPSPDHPNAVAEWRDTYVGEIRASGRYAEPRVAELPWTQRYATARYLELISTYSDHAVLAPDVRARLFADIAAAIDNHGGMIEIPYVTLVVIASRLG